MPWQYLQGDGIGILVVVAPIAATFFGGRSQFEAVFQFDDGQHVFGVVLLHWEYRLIFHV